MKKWKDSFFFPPLFLIINQLHKAMREDSPSPWHIQHNESITTTT
jgi:hypothetical protein